MKLGLLSKLEKRNTIALKYFDGDVMSVNYDVIVILSFCGQFSIVQKLDSGYMFHTS